MTDKLETLTGKIDALRAKGFSDEEINQLLSSQAQTEVPESPFNIGEIFNNGASKEEWNNKVDEAEELSIKQGSIIAGMVLIIILLSNLIRYDILDKTLALWIGSIFIPAGLIWFVSYSPKARENYKFFIKKRR
ncbi:hypothetical protein ACPV3S_12820 [Photobacterium damselae]|uniref:hypothetical protein n=1 Tax=Photobacterium damselae TaxID=38293 RepID=UPI004067664E